MKFSILILAAGIAFATTTSCSQGQKSKTETVDKSGPEYTSAYVCPMHCPGSGSMEPGKCSVCGMDLVKNEDHEMHQHDSMDTETMDSTGMDMSDSTMHGGNDGGMESHEGHDH